MIMTFDFIFHAWKDEKLMCQLKESLIKKVDSEVCTELHKIIFHADVKKVDIFPLMENSPFNCKIIPMRMTYNALIKMLNHDLDNFEKDDITVV